MLGKFSILLLLGIGIAPAVDKGFVPLFNGRDLTGWQLVRGKGSGYVVENGVLVCPADGGGNLFTDKEYANFVLRFEFKLEQNSNNGVGIRAPLDGDAAYQGMEIQILDDNGPEYKGKLKPWQYHGSVYEIAPARQGFLKPVGQWNQQEIVADGRRIKVKLNGTWIVDTNLDDVKDPGLLERHPGVSRASGYIGFLGHGTRVEFRNIRIRVLP
jgi:hypothetical protein